MAWIESHQTLANHPKTLKLARLLNVPRVTAVGHLHFLWWWALDYAQDGDLSRFDPMDMAVAADWQGDPPILLDALQRAGFVDEAGHLHDWHDYAGRLIERRKADAERKREARSKDVHRPSVGHPEDGVRNRTVPNRTEPNRTEPDRVYGAEAPAPAARKTKKREQVPEEFFPDDKLVAWTVDQGWDMERIGREVPKFIDYHRRLGNLFMDVPAGWRTWVRKGKEIDADRQERWNGSGSRASPAGFARIAQEGLP